MLGIVGELLFIKKFITRIITLVLNPISLKGLIVLESSSISEFL